MVCRAVPHGVMLTSKPSFADKGQLVTDIFYIGQCEIGGVI
jgi:hypothetical protein